MQILQGTVDMVYEKENGDLFLFDWKRSTRIVNDAGLHDSQVHGIN